MATTKSKSPLDTTLTEANFHHYTVPMRFQKKGNRIREGGPLEY